MPDTGMTAYARWRELVARPDPGHRRGPAVDWAQVESALALRLPTDYRAYIDDYGFGWVNRLVCVWHPTIEVAHVNLGASARAEAESEGLLEMVETPPPHPLGVGPQRLLSCAGIETEDALYWYTDGDDPDAWPIVFRDAEGWEWNRYDLSLVGFLLALFTGEVEPRDYATGGYIGDRIVFDTNPWQRPSGS